MACADFVTPILKPQTIDARFRDCDPDWLPFPGLPPRYPTVLDRPLRAGRSRPQFFPTVSL